MAASAEGEQVVQVPVERIAPNPRQPRRRFDGVRLERLAESLRSQGVIQPIVVRPHPERSGRFELVAGERRLRAARLLGWKSLPALVRHVSGERLLEIALVENLQREELDPIEEALAYRALLNSHGYTQEHLARRLGRDRSTIANMVRLLALPQAVQEDLMEERLTVGHARSLLALADVAAQLAVRQEVLQRGLSVRATEKLVRAELGAAAGGKPRPPAVALPDPHLETVREALERRLGTRVRLADHRDGLGKIEIEYYSVDDFNRIYDKLMGR